MRREGEESGPILYQKIVWALIIAVCKYLLEDLNIYAPPMQRISFQKKDNIFQIALLSHVRHGSNPKYFPAK